MKQNVLKKISNMTSGIAAEIILTVILMSAAFLIGFIILKVVR